MEATPPSDAFLVPMWVPVMGSATSALLILVDVHV
jgi:hypothetical protein